MDVSGDSVTLLAVSPLAVRAGVCAGMTATAARSLLPGLTLIQNNPDGERADFESLAAALGRFSPRLCTDAPRALLLEISGCVRLFGSESALAAQAANGTFGFAPTHKPTLRQNQKSHFFANALTPFRHKNLS